MISNVLKRSTLNGGGGVGNPALLVTFIEVSVAVMSAAREVPMWLHMAKVSSLW
jgi:hypothetical protein